MVISAFDRLRRSAAACAIALWAGGGGAHGAEAASPWDGDARSAVRLIAGSAVNAGSGLLLAGLEVRLGPGWHTYWRYPGDAGVPPRFDFAGSDNVESVSVRWPAPRPIREGGVTAIGYTQHLVLPLLVRAHDPDRPATLKLKLDYAVCEKLCVPAQANARMTLAGAPSPYDAALAASQSRVPKQRRLGEGETFAIRALRREGGQGIVEVAAPPDTRVDLFVEGPTAEWAPPIPVPAGAPLDGVHRFVFDLDGAPPGAQYEGAALTVTAVGPEAIEVTAVLP